MGAIFHQAISTERASKDRLDRTYHQVANNDLEDLGPQTGPACKQLLENADQDMAQRGADESTVRSHLRDSRSEVVAMLVPVLCNPRCKEFL